MGGPKGINWTEAFKFYCEPIEGKFPSYRNVAEKFGVSRKEVGVRAKREEWVKGRQDLYKTAKEKFLEDRSTLLADADKRHLEIWQEIQKLASIRLNEHRKKVDLRKTRSLKQLVWVLKVAIEGERAVIGIPNEIRSFQKGVRPDEPLILPPELIAEIDALSAAPKSCQNE